MKIVMESQREKKQKEAFMRWYKKEVAGKVSTLDPAFLERVDNAADRLQFKPEIPEMIEVIEDTKSILEDKIWIFG
jgi:hypothetical protein